MLVTQLFLGAVILGASVMPALPAQSAAALSSHGAGRPVTPVIQESAPHLQQVFSIDIRDVSLGEALKEIDRRAKLGLAYTPRVVPVTRRVTLTANKITAHEALKRVLEGTGVRVEVTADGAITLVKDKTNVPSEKGTIVGRITDKSTGQTVTAAEIFLEQTEWRTASDSTGWYRLSDVDTGNYRMTVRRLGYKKTSQQVTVRAGREDTVDVAVVAGAVTLNELVTTATGLQRRRDIGNAVTTIHADSVLQQAPIRSLTDLLENRVPGMSVQHTSGAPGDPARIRLRGIGSIMRSNDPIVIVDGVRIYSAQSEARSGNLSNSGTNSSTPAPSPIDQIDPNIIEKVEVFKGPSAATLYGADAANGVFVITTKKGRPGPTRWTVNASHGRLGNLTRYAGGYYSWGHSIDNNIQRFCVVDDAICVRDSLVRYQALNDPDLTVLGQGRSTSASLTASGGNQALTYSITGSYSDEVGLLTMPSLEVARFRTRFNRDPDDWMRRPHRYKVWNVGSSIKAMLGATAEVTITTRLTQSKQQRSDLEQRLSDLSATYVDAVNGVYYTPSGGSLNSSLSYLEDYYTKTTASSTTFAAGLSTNWRPNSWINISGNAGVDVNPRNDERFRAAGMAAPTDSGALSRGTGSSLVSTINFQGSARRPLGWGLVFQPAVGVNFTSTNTNDLSSSASRGLTPGTNTLPLNTSSFDRHSGTSVFGWYVEPRLVGQRLSLSTGVRLDGSSTYGTRVQLLSLPKLNGAWTISEEPWFPFKSLFSSLLLRGAYGQAQVQPGPTDRLRLYGYSAGGEGLTLASLGNTDLRPERSVEIEGGFDADILDSRISLGVTAYRKTKVDALAQMQLPQSVHGGGTVIRNIGNIRNTGLEFSANITPVQLPALTWTAGLFYARNTNVLVKLGRGVKSDKHTGLVEGYDLYGRWARPILGYVDHNGNGILEISEIQVGDSLLYMGRLNPAYEAGLHTSMVMFNGAFSVTAGFSYEAGATQVNDAIRSNWVLVRGIVDPAAPFSEQAAALASIRGVGLGLQTDYGLTYDISTFRFKSLSVNYRAPVKIARLLGTQQLMVAVQGDNLALHSSYQGRDPDVMNWSAREGIADGGQLSQPRLWRLSVSLQY